MRSFTLLIILLFTNALHASDPSIEQFLREFHENPEKMMDKLPPEIRDGEVIDRGFINSERLDQQLMEEKQRLREEIAKRAEVRNLHPSLFIGPKDGDEAATLVDGGEVIRNILELDRRGLKSHKLPDVFWSDTYWPIADGLLANRYAEPTFPQNKDWVANHASYMTVPTFMIATDNLSPAEKYDLLVGDNSMGMTNYSWNNGKQYVERYGKVPGWMGICHGWSAANQRQMPIPYAPLELTAANGSKIRFYQSDVKALITMLWAKADVPTRFVGYRCSENPPRDNTGRVIDEKCYDTNAATFFLALTNQLGIKNRSFVMDATHDAEVWNFAVISYKSTYFNPQTMHQTDDVKKAMVPVNQFTIDKFKHVRAPGTAYVVGVTMDVTHLNETKPSHAVQTKVATVTQRYVLDLELDANQNIIGGEWYIRTHPDFLWGYAPDAVAYAPGDYDINANDWNVNGPVPSSWAAAAQKSSARGVPLYSVIRRILEVADTKKPTNNGNQ